MFEEESACAGIVAGDTGTERSSVSGYGGRVRGEGYQPRKRTFSPWEQDGRSERRMRRVGRGPLLIALGGYDMQS